MFALLIFLHGCLCFHFVSLGEAREFHINSFSSARIYSFVKHEFHYLEASKQTTFLVSEVVDCAMKCLMAGTTCLSLNMASLPDKEDFYWCELLVSDMYNNSQNFRENATTDHYSKLVSV